jgi:hypothetical protein
MQNIEILLTWLLMAYGIMSKSLGKCVDGVGVKV